MPQDGSNNYQYPPGTPGVPDQTIESEAYNTFLDDLVSNDLNIPRPIHRGGTGASNADEALSNLGGEKSSQVVGNYDSHVWMPGSFYSATSATNAPVAGHAFAGIAYSSDPAATPPANLNVVVEARDQSDTTVPGRLYVREKKAGIWGAWTEQVGGAADLTVANDARYVNVTGDTMTGALVAAVKGNQFGNASGATYNSPLARGDANLLLYNSGEQNWAGLGTDAEGNVWIRTGVTGTPSAAFAVDANGGVRITGTLFNNSGGLSPTQGSVPGGYINPAGTSAQWTIENGSGAEGGLLAVPSAFYLGSWSNHSLIMRANNVDQWTFNTSGQLIPAGGYAGNWQPKISITAVNPKCAIEWGHNNNAYHGTLGAHSGGGQPYISFTCGPGNAANTFMCYAGVKGSAIMGADGYTQFINVPLANTDNQPGTIVATVGFPNQASTASGLGSLIVNGGIASNNLAFFTGIYCTRPADRWESGGNLWISGTPYRPGAGPWVDPSDQRIKTVIDDYKHGLNEIRQVRPVRYVFKGNSAMLSGDLLKQREDGSKPTIEEASIKMHEREAAEQKEFIGVVAQEIEVPLPETVSLAAGIIDSKVVNDLRIYDSNALVYALINAVKELASRVEQLEASR